MEKSVKFAPQNTKFTEKSVNFTGKCKNLQKEV